MQIRNITKKNEIEAMRAKSPLALTRGLMFKKSGNMLLEFPFSARHGIWMLCMKYPLDLIFLDSEKRVTETIKNVPPLTLDPRTWKIYHPKKVAKYVLEIEAEAKNAQHINIAVGDHLEFDDNRDTIPKKPTRI